MASPVKKSKGKRQREADSLPEGAEAETQPSSPKKGRLTDRPKDPQELQTTETRKESSPKKSSSDKTQDEETSSNSSTKDHRCAKDTENPSSRRATWLRL